MVEVTLGMLTAGLRYWVPPREYTDFLLFGVHAALLFQTLAIIPRLNKRAQIVIDGGQPPASKIHLLYVLLEAFKVVWLVVVACNIVYVF